MLIMSTQPISNRNERKYTHLSSSSNKCISPICGMSSNMTNGTASIATNNEIQMEEEEIETST